MSDLSEFEQLSTKQKLPCRIGTIFHELTPEEHALFDKACASRETVSTGALAKWLQARGHKVNISQAVHHRAKTCSCYGRA